MHNEFSEDISTNFSSHREIAPVEVPPFPFPSNELNGEWFISMVNYIQIFEYDGQHLYFLRDTTNPFFIRQFYGYQCKLENEITNLEKEFIEFWVTIPNKKLTLGFNYSNETTFSLNVLEKIYKWSDLSKYARLFLNSGNEIPSDSIISRARDFLNRN